LLSLILSNDIIMVNKYYEGTAEIIRLSTEIGKFLGIIEATNRQKPKTALRRENKIKTIFSSLYIEGNTLSLEQMTDLIDNKRVFGPAKDILEVKNAIKVYNMLSEFNPFGEEDYLKAHRFLMEGLVDNPGEYRTKGVGIFKGDVVAHVAPPAWNVSFLMKGLFDYLENQNDSFIIKSCVFHYEMEFVHPFMDGNGRMGRLWQTLILMQENPVFEFLPIEQEIKNSQKLYYEVLGQCDQEGMSTRFIEYMLNVILSSLSAMTDKQRSPLNEKERVQYFIENFKQKQFPRKEYLKMFPSISSPTASRDLKYGVELGLFEKSGERRLTIYRIL